MKRFLFALFLLLEAHAVLAQQPVTVASEATAVPLGSPADAESNTETLLGRMGSRLFLFNGTTWDRVRGDTTNGLFVQVKSSVAQTISGTVAVTQSGTWTVQPGNTANTTPWLFTPYQNGANLFTNPAALADNLSNPTVGGSAAFLLAWDATNSFWRRVQVDAGTGTLKVDGSSATQPVSGTVTANQGGAPWSVIGTLTNNNAAATSNRIAVLPGIAQTSYANGTALTQGRDAAPDVFTDGAIHVSALPAMRPASYTAAADFAGSSTTDNAVMPGNGTNTVLVTEIQITCTQTTAGIVHFSILKRSTADTSGTSASITVVPDDSNYAAGVSAPLSYTSTGPTVGTLVGSIDEVRLGCNATATAGPNDLYIGNFKMKPIVLRGTAQQLVINSNGAITGGNLSIHFKWIETATITP